MDYPLGTKTVDWSLIKIWCCGKFLSSVDAPAHTQLCHAVTPSSYEGNKCRTGPRCRPKRIRQFPPGSAQFPQKLPKSSEISAQEAEIVSRVTQHQYSSKKRKGNGKVTNEAKIDTNNDLTIATRTEFASSSMDTSDLKDTFVDANDVEGDTTKMEIISDDMLNMKSDAYMKQKELAEQKIAMDRSNSLNAKNVKVMILNAHGVIKKLEERKRENLVGNLAYEPSPVEVDIKCNPENESVVKPSLQSEKTTISHSAVFQPVNQESAMVTNQPFTQSINENSTNRLVIQESVMVSNEPSTPRTFVALNPRSTPPTIITPNQPSTSQTIMASDQLSTSRTVMALNRCSTPQTIIALNQFSSPRTIGNSIQLSTSGTILDSNQLSTPRTSGTSVKLSTPSTIMDSNQLSTPRTIMASNQFSTSRTIVASNTRSNTQRTIISSNQISTPRTIMASNKRSTTPRTIMASNKRSTTPRTIVASNKRSTTPRTIVASNKRSTTPRTIMASNKRSTTPRTIMASNQLSTPQNMDTVIAEERNAQISTNNVSQGKKIIAKVNDRRNSNKKDVPNDGISKVKSRIKTNSSNNETPVNCQQKIKIKKEKKENCSKIDKDLTLIGANANDSDNESVSIDMDLSCKVKDCLANFWFKSQLDQHTADVHNS